MRSTIWTIGEGFAALGRVAALGILLGFVSACQTADVTAQPDYFTQIRLAQVDVDFSGAQRPLLVADIDGQVSAQAAGGTGAGALGTRLGLVNQQGRQSALEAAIAETVRAHVDDALRPMFTGTRPVRAVVSVRSVFIRSRASLQQLTGAAVTVNGQRRPNHAQFVAELTLYDLETGIPVQNVQPITRTDDGTIALAGGGPRGPVYGRSPRLSQLVFEYAQAAANALRRGGSGSDFSIPADQADMTTIFERRTVTTF